MAEYWKIVERSKNSGRGRAWVKVRCSCGADTRCYGWSWAAHGFRRCSGCHAKLMYRSHEIIKETLVNNVTPASSLVPARKPVATQDLWVLVDAEIAEQENARNVFTAFTITSALRAKHPDLELVHDDIRARVHFQMEWAADYDMTIENWNGEDAKTYRPSPTVVLGTVSTATATAPISTPTLPAPKTPVIGWDDDAT